MRPHQILKPRPDGTRPFSRTVIPDDKPGTFFQQEDAKAKDRQAWEKATVARLKALPLDQWQESDSKDYEDLKWPSLQNPVRDAHQAAPPAPLPAPSLAPVAESFTTAAPAETVNLTGNQPGPETNGAAVMQNMRDEPRKQPTGPRFTAENVPGSTPVILDLLNTAPPDKVDALLAIALVTSTPANVRIAQMKGALK